MSRKPSRILLEKLELLCTRPWSCQWQLFLFEWCLPPLWDWQLPEGREPRLFSHHLVRQHQAHCLHTAVSSWMFGRQGGALSSLVPLCFWSLGCPCLPGSQVLRVIHTYFTGPLKQNQKYCYWTILSNFGMFIVCPVSAQWQVWWRKLKMRKSPYPPRFDLSLQIHSKEIEQPICKH